VLMSAGVICLLFFTLKVFRPAALWARVLVALAILMLATGGIAFFVELTSEAPRPIEQLLGVNLINTIPIAFAYFWATGESLGYYRQLRLRLRLGLAEVAIVNRVLLWGLMTLAAGIAVVIGLIGMVLGTFLSAPFVLAFSCLGIAHASCLFLAFHPPGWYTDWLTRRTPAEAI